MEEPTEIGGRNKVTEEVLRTFLERDLGYREARNVEFQRVHRIGKSKDGNPRPILARFLRYKDCEQICSLGHRFKGTNFQMFRDLAQEIIARRKAQMEAFKDAGKMELLLPSANLNLINCTSEVNCGRSGKNLLRNLH